MFFWAVSGVYSVIPRISFIPDGVSQIYDKRGYISSSGYFGPSSDRRYEF